MPKIRVNKLFKTLGDKRLTRSVLLKAHAQAINALWADAINEFIEVATRALVSSFISNTSTGMSVSTFRAVAQEVGIGASKVDGVVSMRRRGLGESAVDEGVSSRSLDERKGYTDLTGKYFPHGSRNAERGASEGEQAYHITYASNDSGITLFEFTTIVYQYQKHEQVWQSLKRGEAAMIRYINKNLNKYIDPSRVMNDFIRRI